MIHHRLSKIAKCCLLFILMLGIIKPKNSFALMVPNLAWTLRSKIFPLGWASPLYTNGLKLCLGPSIPINNEVEILSLTFPHLSQLMGGTGKAKIIWENLRLGHNPILSDDYGTSPQLCSEQTTFYHTSASNKVSHLSKVAKQTLRSILNGRKLIPGTIIRESLSTCGTRKLLIELSDQQSIESVLIPSGKYDRTTLCVSTQIGCDRGCAFCATGAMGLVRNLTASEIIAQVVHGKQVALRERMPPMNNVVFMGMGDAGRNLDAVQMAAECLVDRKRLSMAQSKITISSVGPSPETFFRLAEMPATLAWSLHSPDDAVRKLLVPSTRHTTVQLRDAFMQALLTRETERSRTIMIAITLIDGINDSVEDATKVAEFVTPMLTVAPKIVLDLIPYNDINVQGLQRPSDEKVIKFQERLRDAGLFCTVRLTRGDDESAACGMLATKRVRKSQTMASQQANL